ncbi:Hypothetical protein DHA2_150310 [Giardia duodenalis]|uniref:Uncharacterized protein n=1 Tax=Giardia intestinalis TaxID=5741 RepID=V6TLR8_GIAIN|nr:Hypothetical protein DHA2_150310 [Giardia intestinalis]
MLLSLPVQPLRLRHLKSHQLLVQVQKYWEVKGKSRADEECRFCDAARDSAEILEQEHLESDTALREYQRYCAMTSSVHSLTTWNNNTLLQLTTKNHPNVWQFCATDSASYQSTCLYNDIFSSFYSSFAILFNACCAQASAGTGPLNAVLPHKRFLFKTILELSSIIRDSFACYLPDELLSTELARCLHSDAFDALFSLVDLSMIELLLAIDIDRIEQGGLSDMQSFLSVTFLYTDISTSLQQQLLSIHDKDPIFLAIQQDLAVRTPLFLAYTYCSFAKAMMTSDSLPLAGTYAQKAYSFLEQFPSKDSVPTATIDPNLVSPPEHIRLFVQRLRSEINEIVERCGTTELADMPSPLPLSIECVREMLLADDADYEVLEHYRLLLSWDHEKKRLVFTPPMKDSTGSFDTEGDDIDFESMQGGSRSIQKGLDLDNEDLPDSKSNPSEPTDKQESAGLDAEEKAVEDPSSDAHHSDRASSKSSQPSMVYIEHTPTMNGLSVKGEHSLDVMETPSIELPTLAIEKPSKIPTPTFTSSYVDRMATEDIPSDPTYKTKLPALEGMPLPRSMPAAIKPECCDKRDNPDPSLPLDLLSDSSSSLPFNYESKPAESDALDIPPAPAQPSVMSTFDHGDLHTSEDQEKVSVKESSQHPAEALQSHDLQDTHKPSGDPEEASHGLYLGASSDIVAIGQDAVFPNDSPSVENCPPSTDKPSGDDDLDSMTTKDLICSNGVHDSFEHDSMEEKEPEDDGNRPTALLDEIAIGMQQSTQSGCFMDNSSRITEPVRETELELDMIVNEMNIAQSDDSLKISSHTSIHSSGNELAISRVSPSLVKPGSAVTLSAPPNVNSSTVAVDVNAVLAEKINPEEAMNVAAPVFMANMRSTSLGPTSTLIENALSYCEEVSLHHSVTSSNVNNIVLSIGSGASFSTSADSIKKFLSDSQTSLGMNQSVSLGHSYIDKARIRTRVRLLQSRAERAILIALLITFVIAIVCTL